MGIKSDVSFSEHTEFNHWFCGSTVRRANNVMLQHMFRLNAVASNFQQRPITEGCTGKTAQDEYLHKSDMLGIEGRTVGGDVESKIVAEAVGEMVEGALAESVGLIRGRRVLVETVAGTAVGDEESVRLEAVVSFVEVKDDVSGIGKVNVLEKITSADDEKEEAMLEDKGGVIDEEKLTLDVKVRGVVGEGVMNVDGTRDGERVVLERTELADDEVEEAKLEDSVGTVDGERSTLDDNDDVKGSEVVRETVVNVDGIAWMSDEERVVLEREVFDDETTEINGVVEGTVVLETTVGTVGEPLK